MKDELKSKVLKTDGTEEVIKPNNGKDFSLPELQKIVQGYVEIVFLRNNKIMVLNEDGKLKDLTLNEAATRILHEESYNPTEDHIVGNVLVCHKSLVK